MDPEQDLVIVSMHEKGFPQADIYMGMAKYDARQFRCIAPSPDGFFTMKRGATIEQAFDKARAKWPNAMIVPAEVEDDDESADD